MRHSLFHVVGNAVWAVRTERRDALPLLSTYARLRTEQICCNARAAGPRRTTILRMPVTFFDYYWLLEMYEEIFLRKQYLFESETEEPVVVDVGSNIGLATLFFKRLFPRAKVVAFEPDPQTYELLKRNVSDNRLERVETRQQAVCDGEGSVYLYRDQATPGSPQMTTRKERGGQAREQVSATRLSKHIDEPVDFLKLDVEGAERAVINDLERANKLERIRRIAIEYHHHLDPDEDKLSEMLAALERGGFGYQLEARGDRAPGLNIHRFQNILVHAYRKDVGSRLPHGKRS
jgi:FkbM family methyltransferase